MENKPKKSLDSPFIRFIGGPNLIFLLVTILLVGSVILLAQGISFVFAPIGILLMSITSPLILALVFYYLFVPLVDFLEKHKVPRSLGAGISLFLMLLLVVIGFAYAIPILTTQIVAFFTALPSLANSFIMALQRFSRVFPEFQSYYDQIVNWINNSIVDISQQIISTIGNTLQGLSTIVSTVSSILFTLMTFPIFLFFLLIDGRSFKNTFLKLFPNHLRYDVNTISKEINHQVGAYIKGRLITSFVMTIYFFVVYSIIGLEYAFVLAILAGILSLIPYIGALIALIPTVIVAATISSFTIIQVIIVWAIGQILDGNVIGPKVIGQNLKMHPLTIIVVLIVAGNLMGILGMIIGIPVYAILRVLVSYIFNRFKARYRRYFDIEYD